LITVQDPALKNYITLEPQIVPNNAGRNNKVKFWKSKNTIVERFITKLMVPGHKGKKHYISSGRCSGKKTKAVKIVIKTFELLEERSKQNPIAILVKAIENASPREEITTIEYGGAKYPQAVDASPQRRIDLTLKNFVQGAYQKSYGSKIKAHEALAEEILRASNSDGKSNAIRQKLQLERQADAAR